MLVLDDINGVEDKYVFRYKEISRKAAFERRGFREEFVSAMEGWLIVPFTVLRFCLSLITQRIFPN